MFFEQEVYDSFVSDFSKKLKTKVEDIEFSQLIFLCIGTDRVVGDSFGPLVGYKLKKIFSKEENVKVIGDLDNIISINNIKQVIYSIKNECDNPFVIAIDAAISNKYNIGKIIVSSKKMNIGSGLNKKSIYVGDISVKGIVSRDLMNPQKNFMLLQNTPLRLIMNMADLVANGMYNVINV